MNNSNESSPYWASNEFFTKIVKKLNSDASVIGFRIWLATAKGDNYLSELYRAEIEYETERKTKKVTLVIKIMPEGNQSEEFVREMGVFPKEISMYTKVLPKLSKILYGVGINTELSSKCIKSLDMKPTGIVMTDLAIGGYKMGKRTKGLDITHSTLLMDKIAHMHAASIVMELKDPHSVDDYTLGFIQTESEDHLMNQLLLKALVELSEATSIWDGYQKYSKKLYNMKDTIIQRAMASTKMRPGCINVLNHGDLWTNNMLFKYDQNNEPTDVVFVDFQLSIWSSLGIDLNYFLHTSVQYEIMNKKDYLIERYHKTLPSQIDVASESSTSAFNSN
ncbi:uncharacterized protein LOC113387555 [Ctenocephalides felis]|uniref:uncharacterized protein LOC113387555 n=1 Tax=Ctenocephalides felis TaxID=7515 RepID=UPI000E6E14DF|nr:uncharacterized protein LOC113387555 [Ctenocephalides felis]